MALSYTLHRLRRTPKALFSKHPHVFERVPIPQTGSKPGGLCVHGGQKGDTLRPKHTTRSMSARTHPPPARLPSDHRPPLHPGRPPATALSPYPALWLLSLFME